MYVLDIPAWLWLVVAKGYKTTKRFKLFLAISSLYAGILDDFTAFRNQMDFKTKYSSQTLSLQNLLNTLFDSTLERIQIVTSSDIIPIQTIYHANENPVNPVIVYHASESPVNPPIVYHLSELLDNAYLFEVRIPAAIDSVSMRNDISAWVNYYRLGSRKFIIKTI